jgi:hypothetical protein
MFEVYRFRLAIPENSPLAIVTKLNADPGTMREFVALRPMDPYVAALGVLHSGRCRLFGQPTAEIHGAPWSPPGDRV